jgi:hypothetical protein
MLTIAWHAERRPPCALRVRSTGLTAIAGMTADRARPRDTAAWITDCHVADHLAIDAQGRPRTSSLEWPCQVRRGEPRSARRPPGDRQKRDQNLMRMLSPTFIRV